MKKQGKIKAIIVAAGKGKRMGADCNKQYILLEGKPVLAHTLEVFQNTELIDEIIVVVGKGEVDYCKVNIINKYQFTKVASVVAGGEERYHSVYNGLMVAEEDCDIVLIHDGARPFVTYKIIRETIETAKEAGGAVVGVPVKDTIKMVNEALEVINTPNRKLLWAIQTPQTFKYQLIKDAYQKTVIYDGITDDASVMEKVGYPVKVIIGTYENIKLTTPDDLILAEKILNRGDDE